MARDPDAQMVVFKDTRGRRSTSQKIRDWVHVFKGAQGAGDAVSGLVRGIKEASIFGMLTYLGRPKLYVYASNPQVAVAETMTLWAPARTAQIYAVPSFLGRIVDRVDLKHPDAGIAEGVGILAILAALQPSDLLGFLTNIGGTGAYHVLLNGLNPGDPGLMASRGYTRVWLQTALQAEIDTYKLAWPIPNLKDADPAYGGGIKIVPVDHIILREYIPRWLYAIGHAGFLDLLLHKAFAVPV